jgi:hypothetical protein
MRRMERVVDRFWVGSTPEPVGWWGIVGLCGGWQRVAGTVSVGGMLQLMVVVLS